MGARTGVDCVKWEKFDRYEALSSHAADLLLQAVRQNPRTVLGLPTGSTPIGMYRRVAEACAREYHCFRDVRTFNLDEYVGIPLDHPGSYHTFMQQRLFDHVDIRRENVHIPDGSANDPVAECDRYESAIIAAGGIDLMFLGLGRNGHIGFNEPGAPFASRTRMVELTPSTREANARYFEDGFVPTHAITMGISTILDARSIVLLIAGEGKQAAIERLRSGEVGEDFPASALWRHDDVRVLVA